MGRTRCEYCGGDVESAGIGGTICNADRGPNDEGPSRVDVAATAYLQGRAVPSFGRVPCNICGDTMTLDTGSRRPLADGAGWDGAVCADCAGYYVAGPNGPVFCRGPRRNRERGAAAVVVRLRHGVITVGREDDGEVSFSAPAFEGDWDRLWAVLESFRTGGDDE